MAPFLWVFVVSFSLLLLLNYLKSKWHRRDLIPGPKAYPIVGAALQIKADQLHHTFYKFARMYGPMFSVKIFDAEIIVLNSLELINKMLCSQSEHFSHRPNLFVGEHLGVMESISFRNPDKDHRPSRKSFVKGLHVYGDGISKFEQVVKRELDRLSKRIDAFEGKQIEIFGLIKRSIINVMSILLIGEEATEEDVELFKEYTAITDFFLNAATNTLLSRLPFLLYLPYYSRKIATLNQAKLKLQEKYFMKFKNAEINDDVQGLAEWFFYDQKTNKDKAFNLTDNMIKSITLTDVLTAGTVTTSSLLPCVIHCLVNHPGYQKRLQSELDEVIGPDREPCISDKHNCHFLEAVIMETTRYLTTNPFLLPHASGQDTQLAGVEIKANTQILANVWFIHHDENIWGDPWIFRSDRFLTDDGKPLPNDHIFMQSLLPFGKGRRGCPGKSLATSRIFLYISTLFRRWTFVATPGLCGSSDPRGTSFHFEHLLKPKPFYCTARRRFESED